MSDCGTEPCKLSSPVACNLMIRNYFTLNGLVSFLNFMFLEYLLLFCLVLSSWCFFNKFLIQKYKPRYSSSPPSSRNGKSASKVGAKNFQQKPGASIGGCNKAQENNLKPRDKMRKRVIKKQIDKLMSQFFAQ